jgi:hypothetical protein
MPGFDNQEDADVYLAWLRDYKAPQPWQRDYWRLDMWGPWDWVSHAGILAIFGALVWWLA